MSLSLTSRARVLAGSEHRSGIVIWIFNGIIILTALKVVCIQLPVSIVGVVDFPLIIESVKKVRTIISGVIHIGGTIYPVNVLSCEVSAVVSSPFYCPNRADEARTGEVPYLRQCALVVLPPVQIEGEDAE